MSTPLNTTFPPAGFIAPEMISTSEDLPAPFGPTMARISPGETVIDTSLTAKVPPKARDTSLTSRTGLVPWAAAVLIMATVAWDKRGPSNRCRSCLLGRHRTVVGWSCWDAISLFRHNSLRAEPQEG